MGKLDFVGDRAVSVQEVRQTQELTPIIDGFLLEATITMIYANKGAGKSRLMLAVASHACARGYEVLYVDTDNGMSTVKDRKIDGLIEKFDGKFQYVNAEKMDDPQGDMQKLLFDIKENATHRNYEKVLVVFDTLAFFCDSDLNDERKLNKVFSVAKAVRRAGGTAAILSHSTKNGETIKGSGTVETTPDAIFSVKNVNPSNRVETQVVVTPEKHRLKVCETAYNIINETSELRPLDPALATMSEEEKSFVDKAKQAISKAENGIGQNALLKELGLEHSDRFGRERLAKFVGAFWELETQKNKKIYKPLTHITHRHSIEEKAACVDVSSVSAISEDGDFMDDVRHQLIEEIPQSLLIMRLEEKYKNISRFEILKRLEKGIGVYWSREFKDGFSMYKAMT